MRVKPGKTMENASKNGISWGDLETRYIYMILYNWDIMGIWLGYDWDTGMNDRLKPETSWFLSSFVVPEKLVFLTSSLMITYQGGAAVCWLSWLNYLV
jgi:hypothetical protein